MCLALLAGLSACERTPSSALPIPAANMPQATRDLKPVELLAFRLMNTGHTRSLDKDGYFFSYRADPPGTVVIVVRTRTQTELGSQKIQDLIRGAKDLIARMGAEQFGLHGLRVQVDTGLLEPSR